jgi:16S rRNA pseudouridine516 synthase
VSKVANVRLDKLLANLGYGSRREIAMLAQAGRFLLDGARIARVDERIALEPDLPTRLTYMGEELDPLPGCVVMMHKPLGVTCSHKEAGERVYSLLPDRWQRRDPPFSTVGRLDKETSGLLLLTDDGAFLHNVISPKRNIAKKYRATLDRPLRGDEVKIFGSGTMMLEGEKTPLLPAALDVVSEREAVLTITEGRYHQVRRMFAAVGNHVVSLHREVIGGLVLPEDLEPGEFMVLGDEEKAGVFG